MFSKSANFVVRQQKPIPREIKINEIFCQEEAC